MANTPKIRPLYDRIVVQPKDVETTTAGGIVIPDSASNNEKPQRGTVIAVGNGKFAEGQIIPLQVKVGDEIMFGKYAGTAVKIDAIEYLVMREEDVMGVVE